jgi:PhoPQ-activated pathogenicity-related protein
MALCPDNLRQQCLLSAIAIASDVAPDAYCTPENARQFYDALSTRKAYREIPTTNHIELYDDENRVNQVVAFANEWLSDQP